LREAKDEAEAENFGLEAISLVGLEDLTSLMCAFSMAIPIM